MKAAFILILLLVVSSCAAKVDTTLVGIISDATKTVKNETDSENKVIESAQENLTEEDAQPKNETAEPDTVDVISDLVKLSESRALIEEPQSSSSSRELIDLRDSHAVKMSRKISDTESATSGN